ncbi:hypothetical protein SELMODRAFT_415834 [Selaginella moellendorffii]|uniref:Uncharacterized protein n=1 Tax=Selaginella moellendorffii TaxID=88036 RepID=D8RXD9_SELML|nr:hypothetical protein SELMODRAFT_415834 [Selaginella moellendorffii]
MEPLPVENSGTQVVDVSGALDWLYLCEEDIEDSGKDAFGGYENGSPGMEEALAVEWIFAANLSTESQNRDMTWQHCRYRRPLDRPRMELAPPFSCFHAFPRPCSSFTVSGTALKVFSGPWTSSKSRLEGTLEPRFSATRYRLLLEQNLFPSFVPMDSGYGTSHAERSRGSPLLLDALILKLSDSQRWPFNLAEACSGYSKSCNDSRVNFVGVLWSFCAPSKLFYTNLPLDTNLEISGNHAGIPMGN